VLAVAAVTLTRDTGDDVTTRPPAPAEEGLAVHGPSGSRWFVLDLPGVTPTDADIVDRRGQSYRAGQFTSLQPFRTDRGFAGPALWVATRPPGSGGESSQDELGTTRATIQGREATVTRTGGTVMLTWPGGADEGFYITAVNMSVDDVVAFAEGLRHRGDGEGWDATERPAGLAEIPLAAERTNEIYAEWSYSGPADANYELMINPGGAVVFEDWAREHIAGAGSVMPLTVDGHSGVIVRTESELVAVWRPTDSVVADFRVNGTIDDLVRDLEALHPVDEAAWLDHLPPSIRPEPPG
jgi:hypothetical protein